MSACVIHGDMLAVLPTLEAESISAVVCDPPYHLTSVVKRFGKEGSAPCKVGATGAYARASNGFMGEVWDGGDVAFQPETWAEVLRVMKPGAYLVAFGGTRTAHRMACAIEDAGFEIRDRLRFECSFWTKYGPLLDSLNPDQASALLTMLHDLSGLGELAWTYGSGFPKSHDVSKGVDKQLGCVGTFGEPKSAAHAGWIDRGRMRGDDNEPGWQRPWMDDPEQVSSAARKYLPATPEAAQWSGWGSALKPAYEPIILARKPLDGTIAANTLKHGTGGINIDACRVEGRERTEYGLAKSTRTAGNVYGEPSATADFDSGKGRWPANVCHDGSLEVLEAFVVFGERKSCMSPSLARPEGAILGGKRGQGNLPMDSGTAARFYYCAKASKSDRAGSLHPTVKPLSLLNWLVKLVSPPGGIVLDPFAGSGTTLAAAYRLGFDVIGIEQSAEYVDDIVRRMKAEVRS